MNSFKKRLVPGDGIEPSTRSSSGFCSTTELPRRGQICKLDMLYGTSARLICQMKTAHFTASLIAIICTLWYSAVKQYEQGISNEKARKRNFIY